MVRVGLLMVACALAACSHSSDDNAKQWQATPPPPTIDVPADVSIAVDVNGQGRAPITTDTLKTAKPDFEDVEHRVWLITTLVPEASRATAAIAAQSPTGMSMTLGRPAPDGFEPALFLTRRGELKVAAIDPKDPFPKWHGQGGRVHRPGDSLPHVSPVAKLTITTPPTP